MSVYPEYYSTQKAHPVMHVQTRHTCIPVPSTRFNTDSRDLHLSSTRESVSHSWVGLMSQSTCM